MATTESPLRRKPAAPLLVLDIDPLTEETIDDCANATDDSVEDTTVDAICVTDEDSEDSEGPAEELDEDSMELADELVDDDDSEWLAEELADDDSDTSDDDAD